MKKLLFVGNSFTYYHDLPAMLEKLSCAAGYSIQTAAVTKGGWYLERYADPDNEMYPLLHETHEQRAWDMIVLQDQSFSPAGHPERYLAAVRTLCSASQLSISTSRMQNPPLCCLAAYRAQYCAAWRRYRW